MDESYREKFLHPPIKKEAEGMKKDTDMKTKMNEATIQALHKSIAHWNDICYGMESNAGPSKCALCQKFGTPYGECGECPISTNSVKCYNKFSVYASYTTLRTDEGFCTVDSADAAEAMLELLVSLLPKDKQLQYSPRMYKGVFHPESWIVDTDLHTHTGITTDGRNAFPQAKYVWEKVFAKQAPLTATDIKAMWEEFGRPIGIRPIKRNWDPNAPKVRDGKCVTCGQVVKKKVTKYRVLLQGRISGDICISDHYFASKSEFETALPNLRCIQLIEETAKEFDA